MTKEISTNVISTILNTVADAVIGAIVDLRQSPSRDNFKRVNIRARRVHRGTSRRRSISHRSVLYREAECTPFIFIREGQSERRSF